MKVKIIATIWADINVYPPEVINSDTVGDYKSELDANIHNQAGDCINFNGKWEEIEVNSVEPYEDGVDEYGDILNKWQSKYNEYYETKSI